MPVSGKRKFHIFLFHQHFIRSWRHRQPFRQRRTGHGNRQRLNPCRFSCRRYVLASSPDCFFYFLQINRLFHITDCFQLNCRF